MPKKHRTAAELFPLYSPNIFPAARAVVQDWDELIWHPGAGSVRSSQALAIDVFGTIRQSPQREAILGVLAGALGLPSEGPWTVELEVSAPHNHLNEPQPTPVDVILQSPRTVVFLECKFTEPSGGRCQQIRGSKPLPQCNGNYEPQTNPRNKLTARCALTAKGVRYWDWIPQLFTIDNDRDYAPCPFAGPWYQWMRNLTVCAAMAQASGRIAAFAVVYVERRGLAMARYDWAPFRVALRPEVSFNTLSFQRVLELAAMVAPQDQEWPKLQTWVETKISQA